MTYAKQFGQYGIYVDDMIYKWFKNYNNAIEKWNEMIDDPEALEEYFEEYDVLELKNIKTSESIAIKKKGK